jgi:rhamnosyltransferase
MLPRIAVALAAYNGMLYLPEQVSSIINQEGVDLVIFVSVDISTDGTEQWVLRKAQQDSRVVVLPLGQKFGGASANFFRLLRDLDLSGFDYFSFADQDDIWSKNKLKRACQKLMENDSDGYSSNVTAFWPSGKQALVYKASPQRQLDYYFESAGPGCTYVMRRSLAVEIQKTARTQRHILEQVVYHDWFSYAYARSHGFKWIIDDYSGMLYRQHASNQLGANSGFSSFLRRFKQVISGEATEQARLIACAAGGKGGNRIAELLSGGRLQMLKLALLSPRCRRQSRDRVYFLASCLWSALFGQHVGRPDKK